MKGKSTKNGGRVIEIKQKTKVVEHAKNENQDNERIVSKFEDVKTVAPQQKGLPLKMKGNQLGIKRQFLPPIKNFKEDSKMAKTAISQKQMGELDFDQLIHQSDRLRGDRAIKGCQQIDGGVGVLQELLIEDR